MSLSQEPVMPNYPMDEKNKNAMASSHRNLMHVWHDFSLWHFLAESHPKKKFTTHRFHFSQLCWQVDECPEVIHDTSFPFLLVAIRRQEVMHLLVLQNDVSQRVVQELNIFALNTW